MPRSLLTPPRRVRATLTRVAVAATVVAAAALWSAARPASLASSPARAASCPWIGSTAPVATRVEQVMSQITEAQELALVNGGSGSYAGNIPAIPALCIPAVNLEDGPQGVGDGQCCVTQLPAPVAAASTWDTSLEQQYGAVVGSEEAGKGADVNLGPTINIVRDPRWGRAFESFGEDPYLTSQMTAAYVAGVQSQGIIDQVKHYAVYNNETNRNNASDDDVVQERAEQEIYMPAFQAAVNAGVDSAMCAYSQPNGVPACQNFYLLGSLDNEFGFQGFVTSDWYATQSTQPSLEAGDDMDMPGDDNYGANLAAEIGNQVPRDYLDDAVERILTELFNSNLMNTGNTGCTCNTVTTPAHVATALQVAEEGTVLLKNSGSILPLNPASVGSIAVIGADASSSPTYSGGGSASTTAGNQVTPLAGIQAAAGSGVTVTYNDGTSQSAAVAAAQSAKVAVIFADYTESEGSDLTSIDLGATDDSLISAVAAANPEHDRRAQHRLGRDHAVGEQRCGHHGTVVPGTSGRHRRRGRPVRRRQPLRAPAGHLPHQLVPGARHHGGGIPRRQRPGPVQRGHRRRLPLVPVAGPDAGVPLRLRAVLHDLLVLEPVHHRIQRLEHGHRHRHRHQHRLTSGRRRGPALHRRPVNHRGAAVTAEGLPAGQPQPRRIDHGHLHRAGSRPRLLGWPGRRKLPDGMGRQRPRRRRMDRAAGAYAIGMGDSSASLPLTGTLTLANPVGPDTVSLTTPAPQATAVGSAVNLPMSATDSAAGQTLTYTATGLPGGLSINPSTGAITGTALFSEDDVVTVTATDGEAYEGSVSFPWNVAAPPVTAPTVPPGSSCNAPAAGESQLNEANFVASTSNPSGDGPQNAITNAVSGSTSSRFSTDTDQTAGMYYEVNMGSPQTSTR